MKSLHPKPTLADIQLFVKDQCEERGWTDRTDTDRIMMLAEELGEVAKEVRKHTGKLGYNKPESTESLALEIVDVLNWLVDLANNNQIDLEAAFRQKWQKTDSRSWETDRAD